MLKYKNMKVFFTEITEVTLEQYKQIKKQMNKQVEELKLYFDTDNIVDKTKLDKLTISEFIAIKLKIKTEKKDDVYHISNRVFLQMMDSVVFIYEYEGYKTLS